jgi:hypothetical protein
MLGAGMTLAHSVSPFLLPWPHDRPPLPHPSLTPPNNLWRIRSASVYPIPLTCPDITRHQPRPTSLPLSHLGRRVNSIGWARFMAARTYFCDGIIRRQNGGKGPWAWPAPKSSHDSNSEIRIVCHNLFDMVRTFCPEMYREKKKSVTWQYHLGTTVWSFYHL